MVRTKESKRKKKVWLKILAPKEFRNMQVGETVVKAPEDAVGRLVEVSLNVLTGDPRKQSVRVYLQINEVKNEQAYTEVVKYKILDTHLKRLIRAGREKILDSFEVKAKDKKLRVKTFILARSKTSNAICTALRKEGRKFFEEYLKEKDVMSFIGDLISTDVQRSLKENLKKIYPVNICEVRVMEVLK